MTSQIDKATNNLWKEREASPPVKALRRLKSPKKPQDGKKSTHDITVEDVFFNSEYFKYHSGDISSLSFCSGDNGENQWKVDSKFEFPLRKSSPNETAKSDTVVLNKQRVTKQWQQKLKKTNESFRENPNDFLAGILSGKRRLDRDLISLITDQMFLAERELEITRTHLMETISKLNERDIEILRLNEKIHNLQKNSKPDPVKGKAESPNKAGGEGPTKTSEDYHRLIQASEKLKKQVNDMEEFLNDYGLVWVGDREPQQKPDFDKIIKSFQRLNAVAIEPKIIQTSIGAKFELPREIPIVLYSNGLLLRNSEFREYGRGSTAMFLQDVEDGYFPSELQDEFPDGVPFEVVDKRNETYTTDNKSPAFRGHGNRLGSTFEGKPSPVVYLEPLKKVKNHESPRVLCQEPITKKSSKKRSRNTFQQSDRSFLRFHGNSILAETTQQQSIAELPESPEGEPVKPELLNVKVRYGKEKTESFFLQVPENGKMSTFQAVLQKKLCEIYHNECLMDGNMNNRNTEFEIHVYGRNPFRLSEKLNQNPGELGIVNNCVINVSEI